MKEEEYDHNYRNNKGDVECEIRILRRNRATHASYRVYLTSTLLASFSALVNPPLSCLLRISEFRSGGVLMDWAWLSEQKIKVETSINLFSLNPLTPNDLYISRTTLLTSKRCILYIYSTNTGTEYFKHALYSPFFSLQYAVCFIMLTCLVPVLFTFYIQGVLKLKRK